MQYEDNNIYLTRLVSRQYQDNTREALCILQKCNACLQYHSILTVAIYRLAVIAECSIAVMQKVLTMKIGGAD